MVLFVLDIEEIGHLHILDLVEEELDILHANVGEIVGRVDVGKDLSESLHHLETLGRVELRLLSVIEQTLTVLVRIAGAFWSYGQGLKNNVPSLPKT